MPRTWLALLFLASFLQAEAQTADTLKTANIRNVDVVAPRLRGKLRANALGQITLNLDFLNDMPKLFGNADPLRYAQSLPNVQTSGELDAGLHIEGCDNAHNETSLNGVPVHNAAHLLGFFSVFNASHYAQMRFSPTALSAGNANRLGGFVDLCSPDTISRRFAAEGSVGLISSQATLRVPIGTKSELTLSGRSAYINLLYHQLLRMREMALKYGFYDANLTWTYCPDSNNTLRIDYYSGQDDGELNDMVSVYDGKLKWNNYLGALHWTRRMGRATLQQTAYLSAYGNEFSTSFQNIHLRLPSSITDWGYKAHFSLAPLNVHAAVVYHRLRLQSPEVSGDRQYNSPSQQKQRTLETSLGADIVLPLAEHWQLTGGLRATAYRSPDATFYGVDPLLNIIWQSPVGTFLVSGAVKRQYLFRTGFSSLNLPSEFWLSSSAAHRPQRALNLSANYRVALLRGALQLTAGVYHKWLYRQYEYVSTPFEVIFNPSADINLRLVEGEGRNYGAHVMLEKRSGKLTGWVSYAWGRAQRRYPGTPLLGDYPAGHERIHELNAVATYQISPRWRFGATLVWASGTPFTAPESFYLIDGNLVSQFGPHNGARLGTYVRLDLSANYLLYSRNGREHGLNLSVYNANMRRNDLFWRIRIDGDGYSYRPMSFLPQQMPFLPSISYFFKF